MRLTAACYIAISIGTGCISMNEARTFDHVSTAANAILEPLTILFEHNAAEMKPDKSGRLAIKDYEQIGIKAFSDNKELKEITITGNVVRIGDAAFSNCPNLTKVEIKSEALTNIGALAFSDCPNLKTVILPKKLEFIGPLSFRGCPMLDRKPLKKFKGPHLRGKVNSEIYNLLKRGEVREQYESISLVKILLATIDWLKGRLEETIKDISKGDIDKLLEQAAAVAASEAMSNPEAVQMLTGILNEQGVKVDTKTVSNYLKEAKSSESLRNGEFGILLAGKKASHNGEEEDDDDDDDDR